MVQVTRARSLFYLIARMRTTSTLVRVVASMVRWCASVGSSAYALTPRFGLAGIGMVVLVAPIGEQMPTDSDLIQI